MSDPFVSLAAAAAVTKKLKIGTGICLVTERDPIVLAKEVATLDQISNGRFLFGIGAGWNAEEMENHGTPFKRRWAVLRERIAAMKAIWTQDEATYHGEFVNFAKPVQKPYPPIILGAATAQGRKRVAEYCDGWIPIDLLVDDLPPALADLKAQAKAAGRDPDSIKVSIFAFETNADQLARYRDIGIERVTVTLPRRTDDALPYLDSLAPVAAKLAA
jgi:probable F420-dependent oxidoreductase